MSGLLSCFHLFSLICYENVIEQQIDFVYVSDAIRWLCFREFIAATQQVRSTVLSSRVWRASVPFFSVSTPLQMVLIRHN